MRIKDFEKAIDALGYSIVIDDIKLKDGQVWMCYGHAGCTLIIWDEHGLAYSVEYKIEEGEEIYHDTHDKVSDFCYNRDEIYDLKFNLSGFFPNNRNLLSVKITLDNGKRYILRQPFRLYTIDKTREAIFVFDNGEAFKGFSDGEIDDGDFSIGRNKTGLPMIQVSYNSLLGWQYVDQNFIR